MKYRLALDLGSTSLGWAMLRLKPVTPGSATLEPCAIIKAGVRIFSDGRNPKDGTSLAVTRRAARAARRRRDRYVQRKQKMLDALVAFGFFPSDQDERKALERLNPYELRAKGVSEPLSGPEFARALFHINQRRGFLSNRKTDKKDNDSGALKTAIAKLKDQLHDQTLGQWLYARQQAKQGVRARLTGNTVKDRQYDFYASRAMVQHEFETLWACQSQHNPGLFHDEAKKKLQHILLYQRPLKGVKPGRCTLMPEQERAPLALPDTQRFRIYQELNNLRILAPDLGEQILTLEQRDTLAALLERATTSFTAMRKALKLSGATKFNLEDAKRDRLRGNATTMVLAKDIYFGETWHQFSIDLQNRIVSKLLEEENEQVLIDWLKAETKVDDALAGRIANCGLPDGYGSLSRKALAAVLPKLQEKVQTYDKAVQAAGFESHSALSHLQQTGEILPAMPYYGEVLQRHVAFAKDNPRNEEERFGKIANPTVHIGLNQVRLLVNTLIARYGHPTEVTIEVARELKLSRQKQQEIEKEQAANQKRNDLLVAQACAILELNAKTLDVSKRRALSQKMQLWTELNPADPLNRCCPYSGEKISIERLLKADVEIEHILPYSRTLDDSMSNKTVAISQANRAKGNRTPWDAFGAGTQSGYEYDAITKRVAHMYAAKRKRFAPDAYQVWLKEDKDFLARALTDTAYLSRIAREYLSCICTHVHSIPGKMTALLRGKMGLNRFLSGNSTKSRDDHRHHALDAMVIGITDRALLKRFADASSKATEHHLQKLVDNFDLPWPSYREHVERALTDITISHKPDHGYQGAMLEDTAWGFLPDGQVQHRVRVEDSLCRKKEKKNLKVVPITEPRQVARHGMDEDGQPKAYKGYVGGSNYCIEIWADEKGRWQGEIISTYEAYQIVRKLGEADGFARLRHPSLTQQGKPLVMRLTKKDYIRLELDGRQRTMVLIKMLSSGQVFMAEHNEANVDARNKDKEDSFVYTSKYAGSLQKAKARRVTVSPDGRVSDPGFKG